MNVVISSVSSLSRLKIKKNLNIVKNSRIN